MIVPIRLALAIALALLAAGSPCGASDLIWMSGHVNDANGQPISGALVAIYDDSNKVVDYARTDSTGEYAVAVPRKVLHLEERHGQGFVAEVFSGVVHLVGGAAAFVADPVRAGVHSVTSSEAASFTDPLTRGGLVAGGVVIDQVLNVVSPVHNHRATIKDVRKQPGALLMKVVAPGNSDLVAVNCVYWMQLETFKAGGHREQSLAAWIDPVEMNRVDVEKPSRFRNDYLRFTSARLEPSIAEVGDHVRIIANLPLPPSPAVYINVVARNGRTGQKWELTPTGDGHFEGEFVVDKKFARDDQAISIIAYAAHEQQPGRRPATEKALEASGLWDATKPYEYNPLLVVSRNRADLTLTVISRKKSGGRTR